MKRIVIIALCLIGFVNSSCENKERLEEIKAELKGTKSNENTMEEEKVNFSAPEQNEAPEPVLEVDESYGSDYSYDENDYSNDYSGDYDNFSTEGDY
jgi:hypothetical protein